VKADASGEVMEIERYPLEGGNSKKAMGLATQDAHE
jgi:hypothetical protein